MRVMISGGFDPLHRGHVRMIQAAAALGEVVVALNSDAWLKRKKGEAFQEWGERCEILQNQKGVVQVSDVDDSDGTVCEAIERLCPDAFANGGDRGPDNTPEATLCRELGIRLLYEIGGGKEQSSSALIERCRSPRRVERSWGWYEVLQEGEGYKVKTLGLAPGASISLQRHARRAETWVPLAPALVTLGSQSRVVSAGQTVAIARGQVHRLGNLNTEFLRVIEVQRGDYLGEDDIVRLSA